METQETKMFRAINSIDLYIYRRKCSDEKSLESKSAAQIYNDWVMTSGFSVETPENVNYLIKHIELYVLMSLNKMKTSLKREGLI